jgi:hypothetical protein
VSIWLKKYKYARFINKIVITFNTSAATISDQQSELLRLILKLAAANAHSPVATPTATPTAKPTATPTATPTPTFSSKPPSPHHIYTSLRSTSAPTPTAADRDSLTHLKIAYNDADHPATPTRERKNQSETPTWKSKLGADQSDNALLENPASQTFAKTGLGSKSANR